MILPLICLSVVSVCLMIVGLGARAGVGVGSGVSAFKDPCKDLPLKIFSDKRTNFSD